MINLLPPDLKQTYHYGLRNRMLAHWLLIAVICWLGAVVLVMGGYLYLNRSINSAQGQLTSNQRQLQALNEATVQKQVTTISNNLKLATQVLSKEILFSDLLKQMGTVTPKNAVLTNLQITQATGGIEITAEASNYASATQLQVNLANPSNRIFSEADIESITCNGGASSSTQYPCSVTIRALFAKNNPFLFINQNTKGSS